MMTPSRDDAEVAYLAEITALARQLLAADDPYWAGAEIQGTSARALMEVEPAGPVYRIRG